MILEKRTENVTKKVKRAAFAFNKSDSTNSYHHKLHKKQNTCMNTQTLQSNYMVLN